MPLRKTEVISKVKIYCRVSAVLNHYLRSDLIHSAEIVEWQDSAWIWHNPPVIFQIDGIQSNSPEVWQASFHVWLPVCDHLQMLARLELVLFYRNHFGAYIDEVSWVPLHVLSIHICSASCFAEEYVTWITICSISRVFQCSVINSSFIMPCVTFYLHRVSQNKKAALTVFRICSVSNLKSQTLSTAYQIVHFSSTLHQ